MKYPRRVQVLFTEKQYKTLEELVARQKKKLGTLIRETVEETYLKEEEKRKMKDAADSLLKLSAESPAPPPESWEKWEKEYSRLKSGHTK
ncbi:MAG: hypothetical protein A2W23_10470 [Planctomycetes bacterium RBG_16_43_13]|nr:MAG: hypothetical protein A2W23_10470 [Planctomycetes bacterium RBG_16_43_13]